MSLARLLVSCLLVVACSGAALIALRSSHPGDQRLALSPGAKLLPPAIGKPALRVDGVALPGGKRDLALDFATLDGIASRRVTLYEPFLKRDVTFTVVPMSEFLSRVGVEPSARRLYLHALDDYHVDLAAAGVVRDGLLATRAEGNVISVKDGGPIRLVFTKDSELGSNTDNWIWSIDAMRVVK